MKAICPTCNAVYSIPHDKIPPGRRASATCKKCGGRIVIEARAEKVESEDFTFDVAREQEPEESTTPELRKTSVLLVVFLTIITFGIYYPVWFLKRKSSINSLNSQSKLGSGVFILALVVYSLTTLITIFLSIVEGFTEAEVAGQGFDALVNVVHLVVGIALLVKCFKIRRILQDHFKQQLSGVATFFLTIYYLQYKINRLQ